MTVIKPQGAMYVMVRIDCKRLGFEDDVDFAKAVLREEGVRRLAFGDANAFSNL